MCVVGMLQRHRKGMVLPLFSTCESTDTQEPLAPLHRREIEAQEGSGTCSWSRGPVPAPDPSSGGEVPAFQEGILLSSHVVGRQGAGAEPGTPSASSQDTAPNSQLRSQMFRCPEFPARPQEFLFLNQLGFSFTSLGLQPAKGTGRGTNTHQEPRWGQLVKRPNTLFFTCCGPPLRRQDSSSLPPAESK